jgi:dethiobiotin synthetase
VPRGCFVTGTGTGVGKTVVAAAITAALRSSGVDALALKPVLTGLAEPADPAWPHDHVLLARVCGREPEAVANLTFEPPVSPHLAAARQGRPIDIGQLRSAVLAAMRDADAVVVEGVGGLLVPLSDAYAIADLAADVGLPLVIAASPALGTINHTLLTLEAARRRELAVAAVVLTPWPDEPDEIARSNRETIARLGSVEVFGLPLVATSEPAQLAHAAASLPVEEWLGVPVTA